QPCMQFLFVSSGFCLQLPSDSASRRTPLPLANSSYCQACSGLSPPSYSPCRAHLKKSQSRFNPCFGFFYSFIFPVNNVPKQRVQGPTPLRGGCFLKYSDTPLNFRSLHLSLLGSSNSLIVLDRHRLLQINALLTALRHLHQHSGHYDVQILFHHESIYRYFPLSKRVY